MFARLEESMVFWEVLEETGRRRITKITGKRAGMCKAQHSLWIAAGGGPEQISLGRLGESNRYLRMPE